LVRLSEFVYRAALTVLITLARAAPISVPATPKNDATTAAETEASAPAAIWTALSWLFRGFSAGSSGRSVDSVRGEDMGSEGVGAATFVRRPSRGSGTADGSSHATTAERRAPGRGAGTPALSCGKTWT
jgi:hypothetical protein